MALIVEGMALILLCRNALIPVEAGELTSEAAGHEPDKIRPEPFFLLLRFFLQGAHECAASE